MPPNRGCFELADVAGVPAFGARSRIALAQRLAVIDQVPAARVLAEQARCAAAALGLVGVEHDAASLLGS